MNIQHLHIQEISTVQIFFKFSSVYGTERIYKRSNTAVMASLKCTKRESTIGAAISSRVFSQDSYLKYHRISFDPAGFGMIDSLFRKRQKCSRLPTERDMHTRVHVT